MLGRTAASSSRWVAASSSTRSAACSASAPPLARLFSSAAARRAPDQLPPPLPLHAHPNALHPQPLPAVSSSPSEPSALALLASQPSHYVVALFMGRRYLLTPGDVLTVPKLKNVPVGSRLALTRILEVGSRDYTLRAAQPASHPASVVASAVSARLSANKAPVTLRPPMSRAVGVDGVPKDWQRHPDSLPFLAAETVQADVTVLEHTKGTMFEVEKFKRRKGYRRTLRSKLGFTKLRVGEITLGTQA
ncbi:hypothetical protein JCM10450v2_003878 [Rhodotorula kratochvilovae]